MIPGILAGLGIDVASNITKKIIENKAADIIKDKVGVDIKPQDTLQDVISKLNDEQLNTLRQSFIVEIEKVQAESSNFKTEIEHGESLQTTYKDEFVTVGLFLIVLSIFVAHLQSPEFGAAYTRDLIIVLNSPFGVAFIIMVCASLGVKYILSRLTGLLIKIIEKKFNI